MDLQSRLTGKNLAEFGEVIGENLPSTDEFKIQGRRPELVGGGLIRSAGGCSAVKAMRHAQDHTKIKN